MHVLIDATCISDITFGTSQYGSCLLQALGRIDRTNRYSVLVKQQLSSSNALFSLEEGGNFTFIRTPIRLGGPLQQCKLCLPGNRVKADLFHCLTYNLPLFLNNYRNVCTVHDLKFILHPEYMHKFGWIKKMYFAWALRGAIAKCREIIAISRSTRRDLVARFGVDPARITVIHEAPTLRINNEASGAQELEILEKYAIGEKYFLMIGSRRPHKNIAGAIRAFSRFCRRHKGWQLVITGRPQSYSRSNPIEQGRETGLRDHIVTTGYVEERELDILYRRATALLYPSLYEGFGLPILEAMERGTPVITSNRSSMPEVAGDAAVLVDPTDVESITRGMEQVTDEWVASRYSEMGYARAENFSWEKAARQTLEVYRHIAGGEARG